MNQGDIFFTDLEPTIGKEQRGKRPVVVISPDAFNRATRTPVVLPITNGGAFAARIGLAVELPGNLKTTGIVRCDQPRTVDIVERGARYIETLPAEVIQNILERFLGIFDSDPENA